jgi:diaminohydroxyphosphoribosylaminopyrimidine deaminase/5-amino-6-(5-phosphoribosylamino)uracil reductase
MVGEGWHRQFGGSHAEIEALQSAGPAAAGATLYVTLEPCCHYGKTPPCTDALISAKVRRVVVAQRDPFSQVAGAGIRQLESAGIQVDVGRLEEQARTLNAPYLKLLATGRSWIIAKWAMTWDGKIATNRGDSRWISGESSRAVVHQLRGRVDAIVIGRGTAIADDPLLIARPPGPRTATRVVLDSRAALSLDSQLVRTTGDAPVLIAAGPDSPPDVRQRLAAAGCEVLVCPAPTYDQRLQQLLDELGRRRMTNVLVEGGATLLGNLFDACAIDEVHAFVAPKLIGGASAPSPIAGSGLPHMSHALPLAAVKIEQLEGDVYLQGRPVYRESPSGSSPG